MGDDMASQAPWLLTAYAGCVFGMAWLATSMEPHWRQLHGAAPLRAREAAVLRVLGALSLSGALGACLRADHASMAALVWVLLLAAAALTVAFVLAWRPRCLRPLVAWIPRNDDPPPRASER
jgi:hypothetical protein